MTDYNIDKFNRI